MDLDGACDANRFASQPLDAGTKRQIVTFNALCKDFTCQVLLLRHFSGIGQYNNKRVGDMSVGEDIASGNFISSAYMGHKDKGAAAPLSLFQSFTCIVNHLLTVFLGESPLLCIRQDFQDNF